MALRYPRAAQELLRQTTRVLLNRSGFDCIGRVGSKPLHEAAGLEPRSGSEQIGEDVVPLEKVIPEVAISSRPQLHRVGKLASTQAKQNAVDIIWKRIVDAGSTDDADARQKIYTIFSERLETGIAEGRIKPEARDVLKEAIDSIERELSFNTLVNSKQEEDFTLQTNPHAQPAQEQSKAKHSKGGAGKLIAAIVVAVAVAGSVYLYFADVPGPAPAVPVAEVQSNTVDLSVLTINPQGTLPATAEDNFEIVGDGLSGVARVTGPLNLYSNELIQIDVQKKYELRVRLRVLPGSDGDESSTIVYAGMSTYDSDGAVQLDPPGAHRYAIIDGAKISSADGWIERSAIVTGAGNESADQFRVGSVAMRLMLLANYRSSTANVIEIGSMSWRQVE